MACRMNATVRSCLAAVSVVFTAVALFGVVGEPTAYLAAGPDGVTDGVESRSDEAMSSRAARESGMPVQVKSLTTETTEVWALPDGQFRAELSLGATRVRRGDEWVPVDLTMKRTPDGGVAPEAHPFNMVASGAQPHGTHELAAIGKGEDRLAIGWSGRLPEPQLAGARATYVDALPGVDVVVEATRVGMEALFVVKDRTAAARVAKLVLPITGKNAASVRRDAGGNIAFQDATGRTIARTPALKMWDARVDALGEPVSRADVRSTIERASRAGGGFELTLTPDMRWLTDPARRYPVTIDPQINPLSTTFDTYIKDGDATNHGGANDLQLGRLGSTGPVTRSLARWDTTVLVGKQITAATVSFWNWWSATCSARSWEIWSVSAISDDVVWATQPTWNHRETSTTATAGYDSTCDDNWVAISGTDFFQRAADAGDVRADMGIRASNEADGSYFKQFRSRNADLSTQVPRASVTYNSSPAVTARSTVPASTCATGSGRPLVNSLTPQLRATVSDPDGTAMTVIFEWWALDADTAIGSATVTNVASGATAAATVPAGAFIDGGIYRWRVKASDGIASESWSSFCEMSVYTTVPPVTGCAGGTDSDFNGDGVMDVAIGDPEATVNGLVRAGQIHVTYGGGATVHTLQEGVAKVPGTPEAGDRFGTSISAYDANNDGCTDLAVGVPNQNISGQPQAGAVYVLLGSPAGLAQGPASLVYHQDVPNVPDAAESNDWFGYAVAGSRTASGEPYLVIGAPGESLETGAITGVVHYIRGNLNLRLSQDGGGIPGAAEIDDRTGYAVAASKYHWAVSSPGEAIGTEVFAGAVNVFSHTLTNGLPTLAASLTQDAPNVSNVSEANDNFGKSISIAPYRPQGAPAGQADSLVVVGVPGEDLNISGTNMTDAGLVHRFHVTAADTYTELPAITYASEDGDYLGEKVVVVNTAPAAEGTNSTMFIAIGVPGEDAGTSTVDSGRIRIFSALANPIGTPVTIERNGSSLPGSRRSHELVGTSLAATSQRLLVGTPYGVDAVYSFTWSSLAGGSAVPTESWQPGQNGFPAGASTFGAAIG